MTQPAARSVVEVSWNYDITEPLSACDVASVRSIVGATLAKLHEHRVYEFGVSYKARKGPREKRLRSELSRMLPEPFLGTFSVID